VALKRAVSIWHWPDGHSRLLGAGVLGHSLSPFGHGVFGQLAGQQEPDGRLDFAARDGRAAVVVGQTAGLGSYALEDVVDEAVHDGHGLRRYACIRVDLLQHLVDVDRVRLPTAPLPLLLARSGCLRFRRSLLRSLRRWFRRHFSTAVEEMTALRTDEALFM